MRCLKRIMLAGLFIVPALLVQDVRAGLEFLPISSYYQGSAYGGPGDDVRVDFAVYDTEAYDPDDGDYGNEFEKAGFTAPGEGRFTYVYQVFNDDDELSIDLFRIFEFESTAIADLKADQIHKQNDLAGGEDTTDQYFSPSLTDPSLTNGIWEFEQGTLTKGKHSWFLTISSNAPPTLGDFSLNTPPDDDLLVPGVPEPATMILLGIGSVILMAGRRDSFGTPR